MTKLKSTPPKSVITPQNCEGIDLGAVTKLWTKLAADSERLELLKNLKSWTLG